MSSVKIWESLHGGNLKVKYDTVLSWVQGKRNPYRKLHIVKRKDGDFVELVGLLVGDGSWGKTIKNESYNGGRISYASKDWELAERAGILLAKVLGRSKEYRPYWSRRNGVYIVSAGSKQMVEILANAIVENESSIFRYPVRFLKGIYDAEGCISVRRKSSRLYPRLFLTNSDIDILNLVRKLLENQGIRTTIQLNTRAGKAKRILGKETRTRSDVYNICIESFEMVEKFASTVGFRILSKQRLLQRVVRSISTYGTDGAFKRLSFPSPK